MPKALLIDPTTKTITPVAFDDADKNAVEALLDLGADNTFTHVPTVKGHDIYFIDDTPEGYKTFRVRNVAGPIFGKALVVGPADDEGNDTDATLTPGELAALVAWS